MYRSILSGGLLMILLAALPAVAAGPFYACPPCACVNDGVFVEEAGDCGHCGMPMTAYARSYEFTTQVDAQPHQSQDRRDVGILVFPGVQIIDFAAPYEVFGQAGFRVATVAKSKEQLTTAMGLAVTPRYDFSDAPEFDLLVVPGGGVHSVEQDEETLEWLRTQEPKLDAMLSVCNGAYILARTGLLDGKSATTFYNLIDGLRLIAPKTEVVADKRYVDNGRIITTAGLSSGIDGSLHVVSKLLGHSRAQRVALNLEYNWMDDVDYARAAFADRIHMRNYLVSIDHYPYIHSPGLEWRLISTAGDAKTWTYRWTVQGTEDDAAIVDAFDRKFAADADAERGELENSHGAWRLQLDEGRWDAQLSVEREGEAWVATLSVERVG